MSGRRWERRAGTSAELRHEWPWETERIGNETHFVIQEKQAVAWHDGDASL